MGSRYPGWFARCPDCPYEIDLESLGWIRIGAYSYGKRKMMKCPNCEQLRCMHIIHLDENGNPDQTLPVALLIVLGILVIVFAGVFFLLSWIGVVP